MKKNIIIAVTLVVLVVGGLVALRPSPKKPVSHTAQTSSTSKPAAAATTNQQPAANATPTSTPAATSTAPKPATSTATTPAALNVTIQANDTSASPSTITAAKGQLVHITFAVSTGGTYHGGLQFKSSDPAIDSGPIAAGSSKVVSFTANQSFQFTPFWYASSVQKDYFVNVTVH